MRIVLFTMDRLVEFMLPSQVFGTFAFDSNDDEDTKLINIEADNNEWFLYSTTGVRVLDNGNYTYRLKLEINKFYTLERDNVKYLVYIEDAFDNTFMNFKYDQKLKLTIGKGNDCNVNYNIEYINNDIILLSYINNVLTLQRSNGQLVYINKVSIKENNVSINNGDIIDYYRLKIIVLAGIILINNPGNKVFLNKLTANIGDLIINVNNDYSNKEIKDLDLYNDNDYFFKSPRIRRIIQNKTIKIDGPPSVKDPDEVPLIYTLGPMLTMGMTSSVSLISTLQRINAGETTMRESWSSLAIAVAMLATTILWPTLTKMFNKRQQRKKKKENINKYKKYLEEKQNEIAAESKVQSEILVENLLSNDQCYEIINTKK